MSGKYSVEDLNITKFLEDSIVNLQTQVTEGNLKDAETEAEHILQRIKELNGTSEYAD